MCGCVCLCNANFDKTRFLFCCFLIRSKLAVLSKRARATVWERKQCHHVCTDDRGDNTIRIDILWAALTAYYTCSSTCIWVLFVYMRVCWWLHIHTLARIIDSLKWDSVCMHVCECVCVCSVAFLGVSQAFSRLCLGRKKWRQRHAGNLLTVYYICICRYFVGSLWRAFHYGNSYAYFRYIRSRMPNSLWEIVMEIMHFHMCILIDSCDAPAQLLKIC